MYLWNIYDIIIKEVNRMLNYINNNGEHVTLSYEEFKNIADKYKNLQELSVKLNTSKENVRKFLEKVTSKNQKETYRLQQYSPWSKEEDTQLKEEYKKNLSIKDISVLHGRYRNDSRNRRQIK